MYLVTSHFTDLTTKASLTAIHLTWLIESSLDLVTSDSFPWIISGNFEEKLSVETSLCLIHLGDVFVPSLSVTKVHFQASSRNRASETNKMDPSSSQVPHLETILREDLNEKWGYFSSKDQPCIVHLDFLLLNGGADKYKSTMNADWQSKNRC